MPSQKKSTIEEKRGQARERQEDWNTSVVARLPANWEEQARKLKAFERSREIRSASDLLRGLLASVFIGHSFQQLGMWSLLIGLADVSATDWRKRLRKASAWLEALLQEMLSMVEPLSPWMGRAGVRRILLIDGTHWKCVGAQGLLIRVHTAFDLLAGRLTQVNVTDCYQGERLEVFDVQPGDLIVTDRANGLRARIAFVLSQVADILVRISPSKFPMEDEQGKPIDLMEWLRSLCASAGMVRSRHVWISFKQKRFELRLVVVRLSEENQEKAARRTKQKASKKQQKKKVSSKTLYFSGWILLVTTLSSKDWSDEQVARLYQARWHIELLFKRMKQLLKRQSLRCKTLETAKATILALLVGWALLEQESALIRLAIKDARRSLQADASGKPLGRLITAASWWQEKHDPDADGDADLTEPLSEWMLAEACFDLLCQQIRGHYTAERFQTCLPRLQRFLSGGRRKRPHLSTQVCRWLDPPPIELEMHHEVKVA